MAKVSAGLLLYRVVGGRLEVLLVHPGGPFWSKREEGAWSIPKGEIDPADPAPLGAAEREFREEFGRPVPPGEPRPLGSVTQAGGKRVTAWALEAAEFDPEGITSNQFEMEWPPKSGRRQWFPEVDRAAWCDPATARRLLIPAQVSFLERLEESLSGPG